LGILAVAKQRLEPSERARIKHGDELFKAIECSTFHQPEMTLSNSFFHEPSYSVYYRDKKENFNQPGQVQVDLEAD
jgi:hypothetical protein